MEQIVITIARQYGSGGRTIGEMLSQRLNIHYYDKELMKLASEDSGINEALFANADEKVKSTRLFHIAKSVYGGELIPPESDNFTSTDNLFNYQAKIIREKASEESCIIIGRAADYILRTFPNTVSVNVQAPLDVCIATIVERQSLSAKEAERKILKINKYRSDFYSHYTGLKWNDQINYDITLNSARIGMDRCAQAIIGFTEFKLGRKITK